MSQLVAKLLQLVAFCTPYRCCNMQQETPRAGVLPLKTRFSKCYDPATSGLFLKALVAGQSGFCCRLLQVLLQAVSRRFLPINYPFMATERQHEDQSPW